MIYSFSDKNDISGGERLYVKLSGNAMAVLRSYLTY